MIYSFVNFLVSQDTFGHNFTVTYKGSDSFKTKMGAFWTIIMFVAGLMYGSNLTKVFFDGSN